MALSLMPNEILSSIVIYAIPEGFESLALACKKFHLLCTPFLSRHNLLRSHFHNFTYCEKIHDPTFLIRTAFDLIARIAVEPIVARYISNADFSKDSFYMKGRPREFNPDIRPENFNIDTQLGCSASVQDLLASSPYFKVAGLDWNEYWTAIDEDLESRGYSQHAAAFLLTLLPNTKTLSLPRRWKALDATDKLVDTIVNEARQPHLPVHKPSLALVTSLRPSYSYGLTERMDLGLAAPFLALPSLRSFHGLSCVATNSSSSPDHNHTALSKEPYHPTFRSETIEAVHLDASCIDACGIATFLAQMPNLRSLRYSHSTKEGTDEGWDICAFIMAISHAVGPHLEELCISIRELRGPIAPGKVSMRDDFQRLRKLRLPLEVAVCNTATYAAGTSSSVAGLMKDLRLDEDEDDDTTTPILLAALVPPTVTQLYIVSSGLDAHAPALETMFRGFAAANKAQMVPKLEDVHLSCPVSPSAGDRYKEVCEKVREECKQAGVVCTLKKWETPDRYTWNREE